ncbi:MAG: DUF1615 family protein [Proteobacteria bacterium]|nr:DUF1615 family protein [Pseudomonadota bacterium]MCP4918066.1 DUF1615 family protein [Pseudomonadota bacterium]
MKRPAVLASIPILALALACGGGVEPDPGLSLDELTELVRSDVDDDLGWATDVRDALRRADRVPDTEHACQVLAIIEQESGYEADPAVPGLAGIVERELEAEVEAFGFLGDKALELLLDVGPEGEPTFRERLGSVRTERDVDIVFRELADFHKGEREKLAKAFSLVLPRIEEKLNPVSTAGSMQVNVGYAQNHPVSAGMEREEVRDLLYTRHGGVLYGTLRLFDHEAAYDDPIYRFADFNAGQYGSRNAMFQTLLSELMAEDLTPDGDLLIWTDRGTPAHTDGETVNALLRWRMEFAPDLSETRMRWELRSEKERSFEDTATWERVRQTWSDQHEGAEPAYARVPDVALDSPKLSGQWSTKTFAERADRRYEDCLKR